MSINAARQAENALVGQLNATADALASIGQDNVERALERVKVEAAGLKDRIKLAHVAVAAELLGVLACFAEVDLSAEQPALPVPVEPVKAVEPIVATPSATCPKCGFAPCRGETVCRTCNVIVEAQPVEPETAEQTMARVLLSREKRQQAPAVEPSAPPVIPFDGNNIAGVLAQIVAPDPSDTTHTVTTKRRGKAASNGTH